LEDVISTFAGVRPVIGSGKENPSEESRDHVIWEEEGLLTVTGGKLTTFRLVALEVLAKARRMTEIPAVDSDMRVLDDVDIDLAINEDLTESTNRRLFGRYGADAPALLAAAHAGELEVIPGTTILWAELRWAARAEGVVHLDDLLLRRVRVGLMTKDGARAHLPRIRAICQEELGWDDRRWEVETAAYGSLWECCYSLPARNTIPDWRMQLNSARHQQAQAELEKGPKSSRSRYLGLAAILTASAFLLAIIFARKRGECCVE